MPDYPLPAPRTWEELQSGAIGWLSEHWGSDWQSRTCPYCNNAGWQLGDVLALETAPRWPTRSEPVVTPMLQVLCTNCGHAALLSALAVFQPPGHQKFPERREQRPTMY
jgi:hypothetical protein